MTAKFDSLDESFVGLKIFSCMDEWLISNVRKLKVSKLETILKFWLRNIEKIDWSILWGHSYLRLGFLPRIINNNRFFVVFWSKSKYIGFVSEMIVLRFPVFIQYFSSIFYRRYFNDVRCEWNIISYFFLYQLFILSIKSLKLESYRSVLIYLSARTWDDDIKTEELYTKYYHRIHYFCTVSKLHMLLQQYFGGGKSCYYRYMFGWFSLYI